MKTVKIILALVIAVGIGYGFSEGMSILNKQAEAYENQTPIGIAATSPEKTVEQVETQISSTVEVKPIEFNKEIANRLIDMFLAPFDMQDENGKVKGFTSFDQIVDEYYKNFAKEEISRSFVNGFFYEDNGELYVLPTDGGIFQDTSLPSEVVQITETHYQTRQIVDNSSELTSVVDFEYFASEGKWKLTNVTFE